MSNEKIDTKQFRKLHSTKSKELEKFAYAACEIIDRQAGEINVLNAIKFSHDELAARICTMIKEKITFEQQIDDLRAQIKRLENTDKNIGKQFCAVCGSDSHS